MDIDEFFEALIAGNEHTNNELGIKIASDTYNNFTKWGQITEGQYNWLKRNADYMGLTVPDIPLKKKSDSLVSGHVTPMMPRSAEAALKELADDIIIALDKFKRSL